jgi:prepilin-type N-terminal cleavage/methylation domain-containing protein
LKNRGFTLIEVLVALMITGLLIISFAQVLFTAQKCNMRTKNYYLAINWTQNLIEIIKSKSGLKPGRYRPKDILTNQQLTELKTHFPNDIISDTSIEIERLNYQTEINRVYLLKVICHWEVNRDVGSYHLTTYYYD